MALGMNNTARAQGVRRVLQRTSRAVSLRDDPLTDDILSGCCLRSGLLAGPCGAGGVQRVLRRRRDDGLEHVIRTALMRLRP